MLLFERFIARGNFSIQDFFNAAGITSDEELRAYCAERNMTAPVNEYFKPQEQVAQTTVEQKGRPKRARAKTTKQEKPAPKPATEKVEKPKRATKKTRTTRRKTVTKKT